MTRITGISHEDQCTFFIISRSVLLRMRNVSDKICRQNQNAHFMFNNFFFENLLHNVKKQGRTREATDDNVEGAHFTLGI